MEDDLAAANVNRSYSLAATSVAIFTFVLFFLYPRYVSGEVNSVLFQATLVLIGVSTFSFSAATFYYYGSSLGGRINPAERGQCSRRADRFWLLGYTLLFLVPSLVLFAVAVVVVAAVWFTLWVMYVVFVLRHFARVQTPTKS
jgi:hypothetical protein